MVKTTILEFLLLDRFHFDSLKLKAAFCTSQTWNLRYHLLTIALMGILILHQDLKDILAEQ